MWWAARLRQRAGMSPEAERALQSVDVPRKRACDVHVNRTHGNSVLDLSRSLLLQGIESGPHCLELLGRVTDPVEELVNDT